MRPNNTEHTLVDNFSCVVVVVIVIVIVVVVVVVVVVVSVTYSWANPLSGPRCCFVVDVVTGHVIWSLDA